MNNFVIRNNPEVQMKSSIGLMDYNTFISKILTANPNLALNPNSQLAKAAVDQYNTKVKQTPTLIRPPIPSWFCGYQNTETGQLYLSEYEINTNRVKTITSSTSLPLSAVTAIQVRYESDRCLGQGTPGSYSYSFCNLATSLQFDDTEIDVIDWSTAFYPIELITDAIQQISDTVFDSVRTSIAVEAAALAGEPAPGSGGCITTAKICEFRNGKKTGRTATFRATNGRTSFEDYFKANPAWNFCAASDAYSVVGMQGEPTYCTPESGEGQEGESSGTPTGDVTLSSAKRSGNSIVFSLSPANPNWPERMMGSALIMFSCFLDGRHVEWSRRSQRSIGTHGSKFPPMISGKTYKFQIGDAYMARKTNTISIKW